MTTIQQTKNQLKKLLKRTKNKLISLKRTKKKLNSLNRKNLFWKTHNSENIPFVEIMQLRPHKQKKFPKGYLITEKKIQRWTKLKLETKKFINNLKDNLIIDKRFLTTFRVNTFATRNYKTFIKTKLKLSKININKYNNLKEIKQKIFSKISREVLRKGTKYTKAYKDLSIKQKWLLQKLFWLKQKNKNYDIKILKKPLKKKKNGKLKKRRKYNIDFFKTILGYKFLNASRYKKEFRRIGSYVDESKIIKNPILKLKKLQNQEKRLWFYTNLVFPKKLPIYFNKNLLTYTYPYKQFTEGYRSRRKHPWLPSLTCRRVFYKGFLTKERKEFKWIKKYNWIPNLEHKIKYRQKKNKLYVARRKELHNKTGSTRIKIKRKNRIKQLISKVILPFYGHLRLKQFRRIAKKALHKKSIENTELSVFEKRLDVVVFRLNLAPNIFWARKLIQDGCIFVSQKKGKNFENMYANYKINKYPLKLRDPQNLYKITELPNYLSWQWSNTNYTESFYKFKFKWLLEPVRNINYLTQPGDVIQCAPGALKNQYKVHKSFWQKPIPKNLLNHINKPHYATRFKSRSNEWSVSAWKNPITPSVGVVLFNPKFTDLNKKDRITESFLRWMIL